MCRRVTCERCGKASFAGCGMHVEEVLRDVAAKDRCQCSSQKVPTKAGSLGAGPSKPRWWQR